ESRTEKNNFATLLIVTSCALVTFVFASPVSVWAPDAPSYALGEERTRRARSLKARSRGKSDREEQFCDLAHRDLLCSLGDLCVRLAGFSLGTRRSIPQDVN